MSAKPIPPAPLPPPKPIGEGELLKLRLAAAVRRVSLELECLQRYQRKPNELTADQGTDLLAWIRNQSRVHRSALNGSPRPAGQALQSAQPRLKIWFEGRG